MRLPPTKKLVKEDLKEAPSWIDKLIDPLNGFMENVYQALNKNISFSENIAGFIKEITYRTTTSYPVADQISFTNELKTKAIGVIVLQAVDKSTYVPAAGPVYAPWAEDNGKILINAITGLAADKVYSIRLLVT